MRLPPPPTFPVGPEVSMEIVGILSSDPNASEEAIASAIGADPSHPFFQTDLEVARAWAVGPSFPEHRVRALEREQVYNVYVSLALDAAAVIGLGVDIQPDDLRLLIPILRKIAEHDVPVEHIEASLSAMSIASSILSLATREEAGEMRAPIETLLRDYLKLRPDGLSGDREIDAGIVKKVLSESDSKEEPTHRADEETIEPTTGVSTEGTSDGRPELEVETERPP